MMQHGVQGFFVERAKAARRVAMLTLCLATLLLSPLLALSLPSFRHAVRHILPRAARFGYEGRDQFVRRITLQQHSGDRPVLREVGAVDMRRERKGGAVVARRTEEPHAQPETRPDVFGPGILDDDMTAHAVSRLANVPVVQSQELIIVYATKPIYPSRESELGVEGKVSVQALIDTTGQVVDVQLLGSTGVAAFESSAAEAVWQYRFRPYRPAGVPSEVYALFRFSFRIY